MMTQIVVLVLLVILAALCVVLSIVYHAWEVRQEAAAWDELIARTRRERKP